MCVGHLYRTREENPSIGFVVTPQFVMEAPNETSPSLDDAGRKLESPNKALSSHWVQNFRDSMPIALLCRPPT